MDRVYISTNKVIEAKTKLDNLFMANQSFPSFIADFEKLANKADKTPAEKVSMLQYKVSKELNNMVQNVLDKPDNNDFAGWVTLFQKCYENQRHKEHVDHMRTTAQGGNKSNHYSTPYAKPSPTPAAPVPTDLGDPMQLDAMRVSRKEMIEKSLCFYCKKPGHNKFNCEEKKRNDSRFGRISFTPGTTPQRFQDTFGQQPKPHVPTSPTYVQSYHGNRGGFRGGHSSFNPFYGRSIEPARHGCVEGEVTDSSASSVQGDTPTLSGHASTNSFLFSKSKNE